MNKGNTQFSEYAGQDFGMLTLPIRSPQSLAVAEAEIAARHPQLSTEDKRKLDSILTGLSSNKGLDKNKVWFTREEAAQYLSVNARTIDRRRINKVLPYYQLEGTSTFRFKRQDLDKMMN